VLRRNLTGDDCLFDEQIDLAAWGEPGLDLHFQSSVLLVHLLCLGQKVELNGQFVPRKAGRTLQSPPLPRLRERDLDLPLETDLFLGLLERDFFLGLRLRPLGLTDLAADLDPAPITIGGQRSSLAEH